MKSCENRDKNITDKYNCNWFLTIVVTYWMYNWKELLTGEGTSMGICLSASIMTFCIIARHIDMQLAMRVFIEWRFLRYAILCFVDAKRFYGSWSSSNSFLLYLFQDIAREYEIREIDLLKNCLSSFWSSFVATSSNIIIFYQERMAYHSLDEFMITFSRQSYLNVKTRIRLGLTAWINRHFNDLSHLWSMRECEE